MARFHTMGLDSRAHKAYVVDIMAGKAGSKSLREFEIVVLLAILQAGEAAYGVTIKKQIEARTRRELSRGSIYITLERLERKGYVRSWMGEPTAVRGGRAKRFFRVSPIGVQALRQSLDDLSQMREGLEPLLEDV